MEDFKEDIDSNTIILGDFNTPLSKMSTFSKQSIKKITAPLNSVLDQMGLIGIYIAVHPTETKYTFFSNVQGIFSKIDHMRGQNTSLNKFKNIEITSSIYSDDKELKVETYLKEKTQKNSNSWRLNSILLNNE